MAHIFTKVESDNVTLTGENARHIMKALRMKSGECITICDNGTDYTCELTDFFEDTVCCKVVDKKPNTSEPSTKVTIYQCLPKGDKLELVIQKSVEIGVHSLTPVLSRRCISRPDEKKMNKKNLRYNKIAYSACEQSGRGELVKVNDTITLNQAADEIKNYDKAILFYEGGGEPIKDLVKNEKSVCIFIGPEGGFDEEEVKLLVGKGAKQATLGKRILRTETAPLVALSSIMLLTGNLE